MSDPTLVHRASIPIARTDLDGQICQANDALCRFLGYEAGELLRRSMRDLWHPSDAARESCRVAELIESLEPRRIEVRHVRKDGRIVWGDVSVTVVRGDDGTPTGFELVVEDIDERKRTQRSLEASEQSYRMLASAIPQIVWTADSTGRTDFYNQKWLDYTGQTLEDALRVGWGGFVHPDDHERTFAAWSASVAHGEPLQVEQRLRRADGAYCWHITRGLPLRDVDERIVRWFGTSTDIDVQRRGADRIALLARVSEVLSASMDHESAIAAATRHLLPELGDLAMVDLYDETGRLHRVAVVYHDLKLADIAEALRRVPVSNDPTSPPRRALSTGQAVSVEGVEDRILTAAATSAAHLAALRELEPRSGLAVPLRARDKTLGVLSLIYTKASMRKHNESDLAFVHEVAWRMAVGTDNAMLLRRAEEASRAKDEFLAAVSHELRTPLNAILGWAQLARDGALDPERRAHAVEVVVRNARSLADLVEDLLDVTRIIRGELELEVEEVEIDSAVLDAVETLRPTAEAKGIRLIVEVSTPGLTLVADGRRLKQIMLNLLSNAVKFTQEGGSIFVETGIMEGLANVTVRDSGRGIDPDFLPHVFERFRQAEGSTNREHRGLGLGLSIVRHLVALHGGSVTARSEGLGRGSTFTVRLPIVPPEAPAYPAVASSVPALWTEREAEGAVDLRELAILLVEDDEDARDLVRLELERCSAKVVCATSAAKAMALLDRQQFDVIVSDIGLPGEDGYAFMRRLRQRLPETGGRTPAVALTAFASMEDKRKATRAGFQRHIAKPVSMVELAAAIAEVAASPVG